MAFAPLQEKLKQQSEGLFEFLAGSFTSRWESGIGAAHHLKSHFRNLRDLRLVALAKAPTPLHHLNWLGSNAFIKRDDLLHDTYGGNKIRKFEFAFADMIRLGLRKVITLGGSGSNQGTALAILGADFGFEVELITFPQPSTPVSMKNAELINKYAAKIHAFDSADAAFLHLACGPHIFSPSTYLLMPGATTPLTTLGYVNAVFEMCEQIDEGLMPTPGAIVVAAGTQGTAVGLSIGCLLCKLACKIVAFVILSPEKELGITTKQYEDNGSDLMRQTLNLLQQFDFAELPEIEWRYDFFGSSYGQPTEAGESAQNLCSMNQITLDPTYTSKAFAGFQEVCRSMSPRPVLFWNTYSSTHYNWQTTQDSKSQYVSETHALGPKPPWGAPLRAHHWLGAQRKKIGKYRVQNAILIDF